MTLAMAFTAITGGLAAVTVVAAPGAMADIPNNTTKVVYLKIYGGFGVDNGPRYTQAIVDLRQAAGHSWRSGDVYETQYSTDASNVGLLALRIQDELNQERMTLYFNPVNMYVGGFRAHNGELYAFNDASENVRREMARGGTVNYLPFGGSYTALRNAINGGAGYEEPTIANFLNLDSAIDTLARIPNPISVGGSQQSIGRALMILIGAFSEGSRFTEFRDIYELVMDGRSITERTISNEHLQSLRTSWSPISRWMFAISNNATTPPLSIPNGPTLYRYEQGHSLVRMVLSSRRYG